MKRLLLLLIVFAGCFLIVYSNKNREKNTALSRVSKFEYGGYIDTVVAILHGKIFENIVTKDSIVLAPLTNAIVNVNGSNDSTLTNLERKFELGFAEGNYNLSIAKDGYQKLNVLNYHSHPDQISNIEIIMEKGDKVNSYTIPKWN